MAFPGMDTGGVTIYFPPPPGTMELNFGDEWRARYVGGEALPKGVPATYGYALLVLDEKGYVVRTRGETPWGTLEGAFQEGEKGPAWAKRIAKEQANAVPLRADLVGFLECRATSHNPDFPVGATTVRPIYLIVARQVKDLGSAAAYERRRLPLNEYTMAIRTRYPELHNYMVPAVDVYLGMRARGEI